MRYSSIEKNLLETLNHTDVGDDCIDLTYHAMSRAFSLPIEQITAQKILDFVGNLYLKLSEDSHIRIRNRHAMLDLLHDISAFKLTTPELILNYMIGQIRVIRL